MPTLVIHPPVEPQRLQKIVAAVPTSVVVNAPDRDAALAAMPTADAFFGKMTPELLSVASRLRWIQSPTASLEHYMFDALVEHPCQLTNMRGIFSDVIADQVLGTMLCFARNLHTYLRQQIERRWEPVGGESERVSFATGPGVQGPIDRAHLHLAELTLGIVGFGGIGREVARRAAAFSMRIVAVDPHPSNQPSDVESLWGVDQLDQLLSLSDFVVIAAPHTPQTSKMFAAAQFAHMKRSAYLINIGRGAIVDLADLTAALEAGTIAGAALDVYETEPLPSDHRLWSLPNAILTPHVAGYAACIAERHLQVLLDNWRRFAAGEPLQNVVDKRQWF